MGEWGQLAQHAMNIFNFLTIAYFFAGNGIYTILMLVSLGSALVYNRRLAYQGLQELRDSPATPLAENVKIHLDFEKQLDIHFSQLLRVTHGIGR
ncbi:MAG: hypothetical protein ACRD2G_10325 [Terriglobia bacterium]